MNKFSVGKASVLVLASIFAVVGFLLGKPVTTVRAISVSCSGGIPSDSGLLVNVTEGVTNDVDSGLHGNWAIDNYTRHIKVWQTNSETRIFCADVSYDGTFDVQPGVNSPGDQNEILTGNEDGTMTGGRRAQITGSFSSEPDWATTGNVGSYNYGCLIDGSCTDRFNWVNKYFGSDFGYSDLNWGWTYTSCGHGQWINSSEENSGDIVVGPTDEVCPTPTPLVCTGDQHLDAGGVNCVSFSQAGPPPAPPYTPPTGGQVLGASTGKVLGASTMAKTGGFGENLYLAIMAIGGLTTAAGAINFKKSFKTVK